MISPDKDGNNIRSQQRIYCTPQGVLYFTLTAGSNDDDAAATFDGVIEEALKSRK